MNNVLKTACNALFLPFAQLELLGVRGLPRLRNRRHWPPFYEEEEQNCTRSPQVATEKQRFLG